MVLLTLILSGLLIGSLVYCVLTACAAWRYLAVELPSASLLPPITVMKPLAGLDAGLADNIRSFFDQDYPQFEVLFAVRHADDPAAQIALDIMKEFPNIHSSLEIVGDSP